MLEKIIDCVTWAAIGACVILPTVALTLGAVVASSPAVLPSASLVGLCFRSLFN